MAMPVTRKHHGKRETDSGHEHHRRSRMDHARRLSCLVSRVAGSNTGKLKFIRVGKYRSHAVKADAVACASHASRRQTTRPASLAADHSALSEARRGLG